MTVEGEGSGHVHGLDQVGAGIFDAAGRWDAEPAIRGTVVPVLHVEAGSGLTYLDRFAGLCPQLQIGQRSASGTTRCWPRPPRSRR